MTVRNRLTLSLDEIEAVNRRDWPADAVACTSCDGTGEAVLGFRASMPIQERCGRCVGFGYVFQRDAELDAIRDRTFTAALIDSDRAAGH